MPTVACVIASRGEGEQLRATVASIRESCSERVRCVVVDDASDRPEPETTIRNATRHGVARARAVGHRHVPDADVYGFLDGHMRFRPGEIEHVAEVAVRTGGIAYAGCNGHWAAELGAEGGLYRCKWLPKPAGGEVRTTGMMGACYMIPRAVLERLGGWVCLPGYWGMDEEAMSILAHRCGVPITAVLDVQTWHWFRTEAERPYDLPMRAYWINVAATYRLLFEDATWERRFRPLLADGFEWEGATIRIAPSVLAAVESPPMLAYGRALRARMTMSDEEFLERFPLAR